MAAGMEAAEVAMEAEVRRFYAAKISFQVLNRISFSRIR